MTNTIVVVIILCFISVGCSGFPQDNLIVIFMAASIMGLKGEANIVKVISIEWFIDRFATPTKIMVDSMMVGIVQKLAIKTSLNVSDTESVPELSSSKDNQAYSE